LTENIYILSDNQLDYLSFRVENCFAFRGQYICEFVNILPARVCVTCARACAPELFPREKATYPFG